MTFGLRSDDLWIMLTGALCALPCGLLGCFLVLRRLSLLGDAISHAVLPGLVIAFLLTGSRSSVWMLLGAMAVGVLTALFTQSLQRMGNVPEDAAMGVVFTTFFAVGVILVTRLADSVDLDPGCVLYGLIEFVPLDRVEFADVSVPRATLVLGATTLAVVLLIVAFFKELRLAAFDPYLATTLGFSAALLHYGLMAAVAATTVAAFESVGSILVVAMLIAPGATAHLLTDRLSRMLWIAGAVAVASAVAGYLLAARWNTSVAGMMSVVAGAQFAAAVLFAPRHGYLGKQIVRLGLSLRIVREDLLGLLYRLHERGDSAGLSHHELSRAVDGGLLPTLAIRGLMRRGEIAPAAGRRFALTPAGRDAASRLVRTHRLWESYLAQHLDLPLDHLHAPAERMEHFVSGALLDALDRESDAAADPHGKPIPPPAVRLPGRTTDKA